MKRILFASVDIGYRIELYSRFIRSMLRPEYETESMIRFKVPDLHYRTSYTRVFDVRSHSKLQSYCYYAIFFIYALFRYDVFHFFSGETLLTRKLRGLEFRLYKLFRKRIIMHFVGSDIRNPELLHRQTESLAKDDISVEDVPLSTSWQMKLIADSVRFADAILVSTPDLLRIIPSARYYPVLLDMDKFFHEAGVDLVEIQSKPRNPIRILHAPSNTRLKGSAFIYKVMKEIKDEYGELVEIIMPAEKLIGTNAYYCVSRYELFELMKQSDILIDQLVIGWYGLQSIEALLCNNIVLCHIDDDLIHYAADGFPVVPVNKSNLKTKLRTIIDQREKSFSYSYPRIVDWVRRHHTIEANNVPLLDAWGLSDEETAVNDKLKGLN